MSSSSSSSSRDNRTDFLITTTGADTIGISFTDAADMYIRWSDGQEESFNGTGEAQHTYSGAGTWTLSLWGTCTNFRFLTNPQKMTEILTPINGISGITSFALTFFNCNQMTSVPAGIFDSCGLVTSFNATFRACTSLVSIPTGIFDNCPLVQSFTNVLL